MDLMSIFEVVNKVASFSLSMEGGSGEIKGKVKAMAVRADEVIGDLTIITLAALSAEGGFNQVE